MNSVSGVAEMFSLQIAANLKYAMKLKKQIGYLDVFRWSLYKPTQPKVKSWSIKKNYKYI